MMSIARLAQSLQHVLTVTATAAARATGLVQRERAITGAQLVQTLVFGWLGNPAATGADLVALAKTLGVRITPQGLSNRFTDAAVACLRQVLEAAVGQVVAADPLTIPLLARFSAVLVHDSTTISLPPSLADEFRGCGGKPGQGLAALKAQVRLDLCTGQVDGPLLQDGRASDSAVAFAQRPPVGAIVIRDLGYFHLETLATEDRDGRYWISRLKPLTQICCDQQRIDLVAMLAHTKATTLDLPITLGAHQHLACRLLAVRVPQEVADRRRYRLQQVARKKGRTVSASTLALCAWTLIITNAPVDLLSLQEALVLLRMRWQMELLFKLWKSHGQVDQSRGMRPARVLAEVYAKFIGMLIQHWLLLTGCWQAPDRSLSRASACVRQAAWLLLCALRSMPALRARLRQVITRIGQVERQRRRITKPNAYQLLLNPTLVFLT